MKPIPRRTEYIEYIDPNQKMSPVFEEHHRIPHVSYSEVDFTIVLWRQSWEGILRWSSRGALFFWERSRNFRHPWLLHVAGCYYPFSFRKVVVLCPLQPWPLHVSRVQADARVVFGSCDFATSTVWGDNLIIQRTSKDHRFFHLPELNRDILSRIMVYSMCTLFNSWSCPKMTTNSSIFYVCFVDIYIKIQRAAVF